MRSKASTDWKESSPNDFNKLNIMEKPALTQVTAGCKPLTTFVQTDTNSFREVVQRLTGPSEPNNVAQQEVPAAGNKITGPKRQTSTPPPTTTATKPKLHERRQYMRPKLEIVKPTLHFRPPSSPTEKNQALSPSQVGPNFLSSPLGTPSTIMSNLTIEESNKKGESGMECVLNSQEEERAIKERRFYLHPSPKGRPPGYAEPELLTLFPLTSPKTDEKNP